MAPSLVLRPYAEVDRAAVLALFDANVPSYFAADERAGSRTASTTWTGRPSWGPSTAWRRRSAVTRSGGYYDKALLFWGMAHPSFHARVWSDGSWRRA